MGQGIEGREAGRALDAEIAARVFGFVVEADWPCGSTPDAYEVYNAPEDFGDGHYADTLAIFEGFRDSWLTDRDFVYASEGRRRLVPDYSTDIAAAFLVVTAMEQYCCDASFEKSGAQWHVDFRVGAATADTLPLAICLAALDRDNA